MCQYRFACCRLSSSVTRVGGRPTMHGGTVRLRHVRVTPCLNSPPHKHINEGTKQIILCGGNLNALELHSISAILVVKTVMTRIIKWISVIMLVVTSCRYFYVGRGKRNVTVWRPSARPFVCMYRRDLT